jgi:hypothetical protein
MDCYNVHQHNITLCSRVGFVASTDKLCLPIIFANRIHTRCTLVHWDLILIINKNHSIFLEIINSICAGLTATLKPKTIRSIAWEQPLAPPRPPPLWYRFRAAFGSLFILNVAIGGMHSCLLIVLQTPYR